MNSSRNEMLEYSKFFLFNWGNLFICNTVGNKHEEVDEFKIYIGLILIILNNDN